jgi:RHS repeat-associated protein
VPFPVRRGEDLFVASIPDYDRCDRFDGTFPQDWNIGEEYRIRGGTGNLTRHLAPGQVNTYSWDSESRMVQAALSPGVVDTFSFNGVGQRVGKIDQTGTFKFVWDGENVLIETNASNAIQAVHTLEPAYYGNEISQRRSGVSSYHHFDALGSTLQLTGSAGSVTDSYLYRAFGDLVTSSGTTTNPYQYAGRTGYSYDSDLFNFHVRARRYDPGMGRWWSRDPIGLAGGDANLYRYVANAASKLTDPSGLDLPGSEILLRRQFFGTGPGTYTAEEFWDYRIYPELPWQFSFITPATDWKDIYSRGCIGIASVRLGTTYLQAENNVECYPDWQSMRNAMHSRPPSIQTRTRIFAVQTSNPVDLTDSNNLVFSTLLRKAADPPGRWNIATLHGPVGLSPNPLWEYGNQTIGNRLVRRTRSLPNLGRNAYCLITVGKVTGLTPTPMSLPLPSKEPQ